ncbi:uncharacterized protein LOC128983257 [Macrosteles quadrilineatus]|uniref:uncharacterized protein LOC128983257 n=1 Tax=Macrosteles quadrilineatus TaxID=74068 RepID=UPI0023E33B5B|nr:uncharacterized protein LOC128983257 [Macrosteles quadrilineatus]
MAESENYEILKNITSYLQEIIECPVCLHTIQIPFKLCSRGHGVCNSCCEKLKDCPTCQGPFIIENPVCLKNLLEALPRQCKYHGDGCEHILEPGSDHEEFCGFRPAECRCPDCNHVTTLIKLMDHYKKEHRGYHYEFKADCRSSNPGICFGFNPENYYIDHHLISGFDNIFWITENLNQKHFKLAFEATPIGKLKSEYFVKVEIKKDKFLYASTLKASVVKCSERWGNDDSDDEDNCMRIPQSTLHNVINERTLECEITFFERQK